MELTDKERIELQAQLEVYERMHQKGQDIKSGKITANYFVEEIGREINLIKTSLKPPVAKAEKIEVIKPEYGPGDEVRHTVTDTPMLFTVMEVHHGRREYKLTSNNSIKPVTIVVGWGEIDSK
jgi:hypothetical protein